MKINISVINGSNLNLLGSRNVSIYGFNSLNNIKKSLNKKFSDKSNIFFHESNNESEIIKLLNKSYLQHDAIVVNLGAFSYYSYSIRDCILASNIIVLEIHLSNIYKKDIKFKGESLISEVCFGKICGFGYFSYDMAISYIIDYLS